MSKIKVGDLVQVVKPRDCCGCATTLGWIFVVQGFGHWQGKCRECGHQHRELTLMAESGIPAGTEGKTFGFPLHRLKRIPPLDEMEGEKRDEKLTEPA